MGQPVEISICDVMCSHVACLGGLGCLGRGRLPGQEPALHGLGLALHRHAPAVRELEAGVLAHLLLEAPGTRNRYRTLRIDREKTRTLISED